MAARTLMVRGVDQVTAMRAARLGLVEHAHEVLDAGFHPDTIRNEINTDTTKETDR